MERKLLRPYFASLNSAPPIFHKTQVLKKIKYFNITLVLSALLLGCQPNIQQNRSTSTYPYTLISSKTTESKNITLVELNVLMTTDSINEQVMNGLLDQLYDSLMSTTGYKLHKHPNACNIFVFPSVEHAESGMAQWAGNISKAKNQKEPIKSLQDIYFRVNDKDLDAGSSPVTQDVRKKIWTELIKAEDEAEFLAEQKYPITLKHITRNMAKINQAKNSDYKEELTQKFRKTIIENFNINEKTLNEIGNEGLDRGWPFPKRE